VRGAARRLSTVSGRSARSTVPRSRMRFLPSMPAVTIGVPGSDAVSGTMPAFQRDVGGVGEDCQDAWAAMPMQIVWQIVTTWTVSNLTARESEAPSERKPAPSKSVCSNLGRKNVKRPKISEIVQHSCHSENLRQRRDVALGRSCTSIVTVERDMQHG
jgi:hypothetical protein